MTRPTQPSLRTSITVWVTLLAALGLAAVGILTAVSGIGELRSIIDVALAKEVSEFRELAKRHPEDSADELLARALAQSVPENHQLFAAYTPEQTLAQTPTYDALLQDARFRALATSKTTPTLADFHSKQFGRVRYAIVPVLDEHGDNHGRAFVVGFLLDRELREWADVVYIYALTALAALLGVGGVAWLVSSRVLAPLRTLRETAERISGSDISERIPITGADELAQLTQTVNSMLDRLEDALASQRNMLDDVGHELRTPITVMRGHLELVDATDPKDVEASRDVALAELDRMSLLVGDMITLAKSRRPDFLHRSVVHVPDLLTDVLQRAQHISSCHHFDLQAAEDVWVDGDKLRLEQAMMALVDNAIALAPKGSTITLGTKRTGARAHLWVADEGPGVAEAMREKIFDRHVRGANSYDGTGLGLAIVQAIATAHGGQARVADNRVGHTVMLLEIPAAPAPLSEANRAEDHASFDR